MLDVILAILASILVVAYYFIYYIFKGLRRIFKWWHTKVWRECEHTIGSGIALALLFTHLTSLSLLLTRLQHLNLGWSFVLAVLLWLPTSVAFVKIIVEIQEIQREKRKRQQELQKVISDLSKIEAEILIRNKEMQKLKQKHEEPLNHINELEKEISQLVASDPANLTLKAEEFRKQVQSIPKDQIWKRTREINKGVDNIKRARGDKEKKLSAFKKEKETLCSQQRETEKHMLKLEMADPANVKVKLEILGKKWQNFSQSELEGIEVIGEVERLLKEQHLLNFRIEAKNKEIEDLHNRIIDTHRAETLLLLEKLILQQGEVAKNLGQDEPRLIEMGNKLENLEAERNKLTEQKSRISQMLAEMQVAKPRLQVGKGIYLTLAAFLVVSLLLYILS